MYYHKSNDSIYEIKTGKYDLNCNPVYLWKVQCSTPAILDVNTQIYFNSYFATNRCIVTKLTGFLIIPNNSLSINNKIITTWCDTMDSSESEYGIRQIIMDESLLNRDCFLNVFYVSPPEEEDDDDEEEEEEEEEE